MDKHIERRATPWLDKPLIFSGNYREYECMFNETSQCEYQEGYWRFWYEADHRYALPTVALFLASILIFALVYVAGSLTPRRVQQTRSVTMIKALYRCLSYRTLRIPTLDWNSAPIGLLALAAVGTIFFFAMTLGPKPYYWPNTDEVDYGSSPPIATRTGWMALACLPFVIATSSKTNFITLVTGVSHERLQTFHRWISYAFFVLSLIHTFPFIIYNIDKGMMVDMWKTTVFYWTGVVALIAQAWLTFASWGPLRSLCYEWFKFAHFVAALVFVLFLFFHCNGTLTAWDYFAATGVLFSLSWLYRQTRIYFEHGISHHAELTLASNGFIRVSVPTKATWTVAQHYFVRFMGLGPHALTLHPFTACSLPPRDTRSGFSESELVFFIRPRGGFTARLAHYTELKTNTKMRVLLDGPYGGVDATAIGDSQHMLVIAGGSGAGWILPFITAYLDHQVQAGSLTDEDSPRSLKVILATRNFLTATWFEEEVQHLLTSRSEASTSGLEVEIYYTGSEENQGNLTQTGQFSKASDHPEKASQSTHTPVTPTSDTDEGQKTTPSLKPSIQHFKSRPGLAVKVEEEARSSGAGQSLGVFVCGPLSMQSDVSTAVAREQLRIAKRGTGDILLHLEHFSWA
ncbi:hypothetical protein BHE90_003793 [Fusarium euwallaceae]|uniref:FAD-binding FR-type domain-containing protein n=1 Tax=Fusarium euwallaceae TaxID=1147111 RepID=A0A430M1D4_9HYPO|nr:hypothetical protein BHE90_003793 [Fusarium euwallaceae]